MYSIEDELKTAKTVGITGHIRPDGDCTGSTLGLYNYIRENMPWIWKGIPQVLCWIHLFLSIIHKLSFS